MALKIFRNISSDDDFCPMFFDLNGQAYEYFYSKNNLEIDQVDIVLSSPSPIPNRPEPTSKITMDLEIWDNYENQYWSLVNYISTDFRLSNVVDYTMQDPRILFVDWCFNLTKAAYTDYKFSSATKLWFMLNKEIYKIPDHPKAEFKQKIFVAPNKTHIDNLHIGTWNHKHRVFRSLLVELLCSKYRSLGYIGDVFRDPSLFLYSHAEISPNLNNLNVIDNQQIKIPLHLNNTSFLKGYSPPHNLYFKNTFISIYGETVEHGTSIAVTEKTYDPLIRGHFILPFSCQGFIAYLRCKGFKFPDFINYEYDEESNNQKRFDHYSVEVQRLLSLPIEIWREHWNNNLDIIRYNQSIFFDRDYDQVDFSKIL